MKTDIKDILIRAGKTFVQAFIPVLISAFSASDGTQLGELRAVAASALISASAAGLSAAWNAAAGFLFRREEDR